MQRYKCVIAYVGTAFSGYQIQPNKRTVQSEIEAVLEKIHKGEHVRIFASGRTDAGVHAKGQVIHFDSPLKIPTEKWTIALNALLPDDISVMKTDEVPNDFHARFDVVAKEYRYYIHLSQIRDPFQHHFAYQFKYPLDIDKMVSATKHLLGTHDFTSFCSAKTEVEDRVRTIHKIELVEVNGMLVFRFVGNGFLYNMVRILVGTLLEVGACERDAASIPLILSSKDRTKAGKTAPAHGLFLWEVFY
ncbi:tRNA pseudouridine(38-40) synthase TruA [Bacillus sp. DNRA2]|uniref:tRNA pseudouridine(38-40) synthase TruA n=1 Tax=Bacillus sp. DNRA2 TaxID=2723053 RepID=UPI00145E4141|nr:tRNA pseudouridine(38-40) synthase TruA [Bacillus sp. DNRA2]NMD72395.1 tRNA pseudouridine(38-40) synthase TruA [Bacillus sp. DNRA2]